MYISECICQEDAQMPHHIIQSTSNQKKAMNNKTIQLQRSSNKGIKRKAYAKKQIKRQKKEERRKK